VRGWCNSTCLPVLLPGSTCTDNNTLTFSSQCGFGSFCVNFICVLPYSLTNGDTGISNGSITNTTGEERKYVSSLCQSGTAAIGNNNWHCVPPSFNLDVENLLKGYSAPTQCVVVHHDFLGIPLTEAIPAICGYNQDQHFYCPWQLGDIPVLNLLQAFSSHVAFYNLNCNPASQSPA